MNNAYLFDSVPLFDLKTGANVTVSGERDVIYPANPTASTPVWIFSEKVVATLTIHIPAGKTLDDVFDVQEAIRTVFVEGGGVQTVVPEYIVLYAAFTAAQAAKLIVLAP